jgi:hypothetical protein
MAAIKAIQPFGQVGKFAVAPTVLTGADTLTYSPGKQQTLYLYNTTAGTVTVVIDGSLVTTVSPSGQGGSIDNSAGYSIAIAAGTVQAVALQNIRNFLQGVVNVTGGVAGVLAWVQEN